MKSKSLALYLSTAALTGAMFIGSAASGQACPFQEMSGLSNSSVNAANPTLKTSSIDFSPFSLVATSLAAVTGLFASSFVLRTSLKRKLQAAHAAAPVQHPELETIGADAQILASDGSAVHPEAAIDRAKALTSV